MFRVLRPGPVVFAVVAVGVALSGCRTSPKEYVDNGFKVGPNYCRPYAPVAEEWIDAADPRVRQEPEDLGRWWGVFNDPVLHHLMTLAYRQNLSLREAGFRILQARAQLGIAQGNFFPQRQDATGSYRRQGIGHNFFEQWGFGFNLAWEMDFWGRFRRAIESAGDLLDASVEDYDFVLVTLLADVAANYVQVLTNQQRIALLRENVKLQEEGLAIVRLLAKDGKLTGVELNQATSSLRQTQAQIPQLEIDLRQANNRLCILLGMPPVDLPETLDAWKAEESRRKKELQEAVKEKDDLEDTALMRRAPLTLKEQQALEELWKRIATVYIPTVPAEAAVGLPAELLRRHPDVRQAERLAAAQAEQIGIAESELYPAFSINGTLGCQAGKLSQLFTSDAFSGSVGPSFQWNILNYGRIANNIRLQDARFEELVVAYQNTVLQANREVEDGLVTFLQAQERAKLLGQSAGAGRRAVAVALVQLTAKTDFTQYEVIVQALVQQDDLWAQARGQVAQGLIQVYRALGGGWEIRLAPEETAAAMPAGPSRGLRGSEEVPSSPRKAMEAPDEPPLPPDAPEPSKGPPTAR